MQESPRSGLRFLHTEKLLPALVSQVDNLHCYSKEDPHTEMPRIPAGSPRSSSDSDNKAGNGEGPHFRGPFPCRVLIACQLVASVCCARTASDVGQWRYSQCPLGLQGQEERRCFQETIAEASPASLGLLWVAFLPE